MALPNDPLYNERDAASRDLIRYGIIYDCFGTNFPLMGLLKQSGATDVLFQGTGIENAFVYDYANGSSTQPGATITPQRKQMATDSKFDERFYQANLPVEETVYKLYNAPGDTQKFSQDDLDTYCLTKKIESMLEMDGYRHGQPASGNPGGSTSGVGDDRSDCMNGLDEAFNNGIDCSSVRQHLPALRVDYPQRRDRPSLQLDSVLLRNGVRHGGFDHMAGAARRHRSVERGRSQGQGWIYRTLWMGRSGGHASPVGGHPATLGHRGYRLRMALGELLRHHHSRRPAGSFSVAFNYLPGGNPSAYGTTSPAKFLDGAGSNTKLSSYTSPTYTINGAAVAAGTLSPTGSNIPSATTIQPGEVLYFADPEVLVMTPPKPGSGWEWDTREVPIPNNISTNNRYLKVATNLWTPQAPHGMIIFGFKGVRS